MVDAFRAKGLRIGFYHSLIDWHHPDYTVDDLHPMRDNAEARAANAGRDLSRYVDYLHGQTRELLTEFGTVDILWYDFSYGGKGKEQWRSEELIQMIRGLQPDIILNDRLQIDQDIKTPEQYQPRGWVQVDGKPVVWEACQTFSRVVGLPPRRRVLEKRGDAGPDAHRQRLQRRQPAPERRADGPGRVRRPRPGPPGTAWASG